MPLVLFLYLLKQVLKDTVAIFFIYRFKLDTRFPD